MTDPDVGPCRLGAAVVGTGWGCLTHVPALRGAGFDVLTLVGTDPDRTRHRAKLANVPSASTDLAAVLSDPAIDVVVIASPPETHVDLTLAAVEAGKHVLCEKPFATTLEDATRMSDAANTAEVVHAVGHEFRWQPHMAATAQTIRSGAIGKPTLSTHVRINSILAGPEATAPEWFESGRRFGGWPNAEIQHVIDEIRMSLGPIATVMAHEGQVTEHDWDAAETFHLQFTTIGGVMGIVQSSIGAFGPAVNIQRVSGTRGTVWTTPEGTVMLHDGSSERVVEPARDLVGPAGNGEAQPMPADLAGTNTLSTALRRATRFVRPTELMHRAFRDRVLGVTPPAWPPLPTFEDGVANTAAHVAIRLSIETGLPQDVPSLDID